MLEIHKFDGQITQEFLGLRIQNFQGIVFIRIQKYGDSNLHQCIFKRESIHVALRRKELIYLFIIYLRPATTFFYSDLTSIEIIFTI